MTWRLPPNPTPEDIAVCPELAVLRVLQHAARAAASALVASNPCTAYGSYDGSGTTDGADEGYGPEGYGTADHLGRNVLILARALVDAIAVYEGHTMGYVPEPEPEHHAPPISEEEEDIEIPF
jgi:hypothetical protein